MSSLVDKILGKRLATWRAEEEKIGVWTGVPILGLDGLSSSAYGPEAALTILVPLGALGLRYIGPITLVLVALLAILYLSYRQTIAAYPNGGGSYTVAKENLGIRAGLLAAASLMIDYILNVAVGISAGIGALVSAVPALHRHILLLCLAALAIITLINLRGLREPGMAFGIPTYVFVASLGVVLATGLIKALLHGGHPPPVAPPPRLGPPVEAATAWLILRSFASGCTAMTGVEAVSNGVGYFTQPRVRNAQRTLTAIVGILALLLGGIAYLAHAYGIGAMSQDRAGYQSVISLLVAAVFGRGVFYDVTMASVLAVLALSANTSFADFPRLCRMIAEDNFLPRLFANVGRRLVYSTGIVVLALLSAVLLIVFGGITDRLIPLFAIGAFGAFTLSQAGMVMHWRRAGGRGARPSMLVNGVGGIATAAALIVILLAKFGEGAWMTVVLLPLLLLLFASVKRHYGRAAKQLACTRPIDITANEPPVVVVPVESWNLLTEKALRFALRVSPDVIAVHIAIDEETAKTLREQWERDIEKPIRRAGQRPPRLEIVASPYRRLFTPLLDFVSRLASEYPSRQIAVVVSELVEKRWYEGLLHNHRAEVLKALLLLQEDERLVLINVPWHLK
ncbi:MAG TPA: APC family permease [Thermoanaerobaculia bacterium]|nr:APC family permease [Thermoanaerobaculia bacterium]